MSPWANIRMMEAKAAELGLDLGEKYDTRLKKCNFFHTDNGYEALPIKTH